MKPLDRGREDIGSRTNICSGRGPSETVVDIICDGGGRSSEYEGAEYGAGARILDGATEGRKVELDEEWPEP